MNCEYVDKCEVAACFWYSS